MSERFHIEAMTPDRTVFELDAEVLTAVSAEGSFGIMAHHQPSLVVLQDESDVVIRDGEKNRRFAVRRGVLHVKKEITVLLAESIVESIS